MVPFELTSCELNGVELWASIGMAASMRVRGNTRRMRAVYRRLSGEALIRRSDYCGLCEVLRRCCGASACVAKPGADAVDGGSDGAVELGRAFEEVGVAGVGGALAGEELEL